jgi:hypothetical protein
MKTSSTGNFRFRAPIKGIIANLLTGKLMMGLVLAAMIGSIDVAPAFGKDDRGRGKNDNGRYEQRGRGYDRNRHPPVRRVYRERVYAPPRVIYAPPQPPGISIWFPPIFIHP